MGKQTNSVSVTIQHKKQIKYFSLLFLLTTLLFSTGCGSSKSAAKSYTLPKAKRLAFEKLYYDASKQKILNNKDKALDIFYKALEADPNSHATMYQISELLFNKQDYYNSLNYAQKAVSKSGAYNYWYSMNLGKNYSTVGQYAKAAAEYEKVLENDPWRKDVYVDAAGQYYNLNNASKAIELLELMEKKFGVDSESTGRLEFIYTQLGNHEKAEEQVLKLIEIYPTEMYWYTYLAGSYMNTDQPDKAIDMLETAISIDSSSGYPYFSLYEIYKEQDNEEAFKYLKKSFKTSDFELSEKLTAIEPYLEEIESDSTTREQVQVLSDILLETHPSDPQPFKLKTDIYNRLKDYKSARISALAAVELDESNYDYWSELLDIDKKLNDGDLILEDSKNAIELFPNMTELYAISAEGYLAKNKYSEALKTADDGLEVAIEKPAKISLLTAKAKTYQAQKNYEESDKLYEKILWLSPYNAPTMNLYARSLLLREIRLEEADSLITIALKEDQKNGEYNNAKGLILFNLEKFDEAEKYLEKAIEFDELKLSYYDDLIQLYEKTSNTEELERIRKKKEEIAKQP